jgi:cation/acetate symporter
MSKAQPPAPANVPAANPVPTPAAANKRYFRRLSRYYLWFTASLALFLGALGILEREGMPRQWIGHLYMFGTIVLYATIGVVARTSNVSEYYVAGRRVPALFNGMATGSRRPASSAWPAPSTCTASTPSPT